MAWDGNGSFSRTNGTQTGSTTWANARDAGNNITASQHDTHDQDLADGINACLTKNNETKPTAHFRPSQDATYSLGSNALRWLNLYLSGFIGDANGNELLKFTATASAVNELTVVNNATGANPYIAATGGDTNIGLELRPKGTGDITITDGTDTTKKVAFEVSGITTATTRTVTWPDKAGTVAMTSDITTGTKQSVQAATRNLLIKNNATNPNYQLDITADQIIVEDTSGNQLRLDSFSKTLDITASGANGLDTGAEASDTWYHIWAIAKSDGTQASLLSTSATTPTMPSGYTYKGYLGAERNNGSSNFWKIAQRGATCDVEVQAVFTSTTGQTSYTSQSLANFVPSTAVAAKGTAGPVSTGQRPMSIATDADGVGAVRCGGENATSAFDTFVGGSMYRVVLKTAQTLFWKSVDTTASNFRLTVSGWEFA